MGWDVHGMGTRDKVEYSAVGYTKAEGAKVFVCYLSLARRSHVRTDGDS